MQQAMCHCELCSCKLAAQVLLLIRFMGKILQHAMIDHHSRVLLFSDP